MVRTRSRHQDKVITTIGAATKKTGTMAVEDLATEVRTSIKTSQEATAEEEETAHEATKDPSKDSMARVIIKTKAAKIICSRSMVGKREVTDSQVAKVETEDQTELAWIEVAAGTRATTKDLKVQMHHLLATRSQSTRQTQTPIVVSVLIPHLRDSILDLAEVIVQAVSHLVVNLLMPAVVVCQ